MPRKYHRHNARKKCFFCTHPKLARVLFRRIPIFTLVVLLAAVAVYMQHKEISATLVGFQFVEFAFSMIGEHFLLEL